MPRSDENDAMLNKIISERVRSARIEKGLSQIDAAKNLGVTFQQLQKYEYGINRLPASRLFAIADLYELPVSHFVDSEHASVSMRHKSCTRLISNYLKLDIAHQNIINKLIKDLIK